MDDPRAPTPTRDVLNAAMSEDELLRAVTDALTLGGWTWGHVRRSDRALTMGSPGFPDVVAANGHRILFLELKSEAGRVRSGQREWLDAVHLIRAEGLVLRPRDLDAFIRDVT